MAWIFGSVVPLQLEHSKELTERKIYLPDISSSGRFTLGWSYQMSGLPVLFGFFVELCLEIVNCILQPGESLS